MMKERFGEVTLQLTVGDIADQSDVDAVVNAANAELQMGGGVAGAIHRAAGPGLAEECAPLAPIGPGECVITGGHRLPQPARRPLPGTDLRRRRACPRPAGLLLRAGAGAGGRGGAPLDRLPRHLDGGLRLPDGRGGPGGAPGHP